MYQEVEISSTNYSGYQANVIFTPENTDTSYGLGVKTIPFLFNTLSIPNITTIKGTYSIDIVNSSCSFVLVI
jgi:hypothetical protein